MKLPVLLAALAALALPTSAHADPVLSASATVRPDTSVSFLSSWTCAAPFRQCSYSWFRADGSKFGTGRSYVTQPGVFAAGCHVVNHKVTYWYGRETTARSQTASTSFCVPA